AALRTHASRARARFAAVVRQHVVAVVLVIGVAAGAALVLAVAAAVQAVTAGAGHARPVGTRQRLLGVHLVVAAQPAVVVVKLVRALDAARALVHLLVRLVLVL